MIYNTWGFGSIWGLGGPNKKIILKKLYGYISHVTTNYNLRLNGGLDQ